MVKQFSKLVFVMVIALGANLSIAQDSAVLQSQNPALNSGKSTNDPKPELSKLEKIEAMVMLDYQVIPVPNIKSIDLMGFHFLNKVNDLLYLGVGGYAPLLEGEYGGFMAFDVTAQAQRKVFGNIFADAGVSLGGGGGGKSIQQSKMLSGTGGFVKSYLGLGYHFKDFSAGANYSKFRFIGSAINHSQMNVYIQVPFEYSIGSYASSGDKFLFANEADAQAFSDESVEHILTVSLDNFFQIKPKGLNKDTINVADLQFSHFVNKNTYGFFNLGVGYHGLPLYNQILAGLGYRVSVFQSINFYSQMGIGSGGYAPDTIDTGPGLLIFPKISAEYMFDKNLGLSLSAGYLFAPQASSKNYTLGALLNYHNNFEHLNSGANNTSESSVYKAYRFNLFQQTQLNLKVKNKNRSNINLLAVQIDNVISDHLYIPIQANVAYNAYLGYPGYGELLAGLGVQSKFYEGDRLQLFGHFLLGTNVHGSIIKTGAGVNYGWSDRLAIYGVAGQTVGIDKIKFNSDYLGLGLTYRFSVPSW